MVDLEIEDDNNCALIAMCNVSGLPYYKVYNAFEKFGREYGDGVSSNIRLRVMSHLNIKHKKIMFSGRLKKFIKKYKDGTYYLSRQKHAFSVINGNILNEHRLNSHIHSVYQIF